MKRRCDGVPGEENGTKEVDARIRRRRSAGGRRNGKNSSRDFWPGSSKERYRRWRGLGATSGHGLGTKRKSKRRNAGLSGDASSEQKEQKKYRMKWTWEKICPPSPSQLWFVGGRRISAREFGEKNFFGQGKYLVLWLHALCTPGA